MEMRWLKILLSFAFILLCGNPPIAAQKHSQYLIKDGNMLIVIEKNISPVELNDFIKQYELKDLGLQTFLSTNKADSIAQAGWEIVANTKEHFIIQKSMLPLEDLSNTANRIQINLPPSFDVRFPSVSKQLIYGMNRFKNKSPFKIQDSVVTFYLKNNLKADKVILAGSFNNWNPDSLLMTKTDSGWVAQVKLSPGKYWYKFIIDGRWIIDTDNKNVENDGEGNINSVFYFPNYKFVLPGFATAKKIILAGSFNGWNPDEIRLEKAPSGWIVNMYLAEGTHTYRYIVDGKWIEDPSNPNKFPNEHGHFNSYVSVGTPHLFSLMGYLNAQSVVLSGSFNNWKTYELLLKRTSTGWELPYVLGPGNYAYKYIVDGVAVADPLSTPYDTIKKESLLILQPNYTFLLKGFSEAKTVNLAGDFNSWNPESLSMKKTQNGWETTVNLSTGKHLYKFIVDGKWILDPDNKLWEDNEHGTGNSILWIDKL